MLTSRPRRAPREMARTGFGDTGSVGSFAFSHTFTRTDGNLSGAGVSICATASENTSPTASASA